MYLKLLLTLYIIENFSNYDVIPNANVLHFFMETNYFCPHIAETFNIAEFFSNKNFRRYCRVFPVLKLVRHRIKESSCFNFGMLSLRFLWKFELIRIYRLREDIYFEVMKGSPCNDTVTISVIIENNLWCTFSQYQG